MEIHRRQEWEKKRGDSQKVRLTENGENKKRLITSSFLLNVYSTCDCFAINRYTVTALGATNKVMGYGNAFDYDYTLSGKHVKKRTMVGMLC